MRIIDVSLTVNYQLPVWPGDPPFSRTLASKIEAGAEANVSRVETGVHVGTHVDAPFHFISGGKTIDQLALETLIGPVLVVGIPEDVAVITADTIKQAGLPSGVTRTLFKTRNSRLWKQPHLQFDTGYVAVDNTGAQYLVDCGVQLVGIDYFSIAPFVQTQPTHLTLLRAGVVIIEGLDLSNVEPGNYMLYCLPIKLGGSDGAPARVILTREDPSS
jgi:arylformamidase